MLKDILRRFATTKPDPMVMPFAQQGDAVDPIDDPNNVKDVTLQRGFTPPYSKLKKDGGKYVGRAEFNGVIKWLSRFVCYQNYGGLYSFEQKIAAVGGYPKDAVLFYPAKQVMLISLKDNNTDDFTKDPSVIGKSWNVLFDIDVSDFARLSKANAWAELQDFKKGATTQYQAIKDDDTSLLVATFRGVAEIVKRGITNIPDATTTTKGKLRFSTNPEAITGTDETTGITPFSLKAVIQNYLSSYYDKGTSDARFAKLSRITFDWDNISRIMSYIDGKQHGLLALTTDINANGYGIVQMGGSFPSGVYLVFKDGLRIQYGYSAASQPATGRQINFPLAFTSQSYTVNLTCNTDFVNIATYQSQTQTKIFIQAWNIKGELVSNVASMTWLAIGY